MRITLSAKKKIIFSSYIRELELKRRTNQPHTRQQTKKAYNLHKNNARKWAKNENRVQRLPCALHNCKTNVDTERNISLKKSIFFCSPSWRQNILWEQNRKHCHIAHSHDAISLIFFIREYFFSTYLIHLRWVFFASSSYILLRFFIIIIRGLGGTICYYVVHAACEIPF